jgi:hypothetical protein
VERQAHRLPVGVSYTKVRRLDRARDSGEVDVEEMKACEVCGSRGATLHDMRFHALADKVARLTRVVCWLGSALGPLEWNEVDQALQGKPSEVDKIDVPMKPEGG